jgi:hypothetical protein
MQVRKELTDRVLDQNGNAINFRYLDGLLIEDHTMLLMRHFLFKKATGEAPPKETTGKDFRRVKDYLMRFYVDY